MNKLMQMGRLCADPEIRTSQNGQQQIAKFNLAVDRRFKREGDPDADFFQYTAFGKLAEWAGKYLRKGTKVVVEGRIQNDNYTNKDGVKVYGFQFLAESIEFAESKKTEGGNGNAGAAGTDAPAPAAEAPAPAAFEMPQDDLPFA